MLMPIILDCREFTWEFQSFKIQHAFREANAVADSLTRMAREDLQSYHESVYYDSPPTGMIDSLLLDQMGVSSTRSVCTNQVLSNNYG